ncbi:MAG: BatA domain-containing protein, partial [Povalibacter sp.]
MFAAPAFFAALLAIALPLWLHRVAQANPARHAFPSLMLMEASEIQRTARRTLRYWMLLALRCLLLIALILAFAGPLLPRRAVPTVHPAGRLHAIVFDDSLSMTFGDRWQRAHAAARSIIESARPGDELMLVQAAGQKIQVVQDAVPAVRAGNVSAALDTIVPGSQRLDFGLLMSTAKGWLGAARLPVEFHLISDLQQTASPLRFADLEPPPGTRLEFHDVGESDAANTYIRGATVLNGKVSVAVRTTAHSNQTLQAVAVVDGAEVARRSFQVGPAPSLTAAREGEGNPLPDPLRSTLVSANVEGVDTEVLLELPEVSPTPHRLEVRLVPGDKLAGDDRYFVVLEPTDPRVLVLARANDSDEALYATSAVDALSAPKLKSEVHAAQELDLRTLHQFATIIITDPSALSSEA